jgi:hypothetical protein
MNTQTNKTMKMTPANNSPVASTSFGLQHDDHVRFYQFVRRFDGYEDGYTEHDYFRDHPLTVNGGTL